MTSKNERAAKICGLRNTEGIAIDSPCELGFICPKCGDVGEFLEWSEYNTFIWCEKCDTDYPSCLCLSKRNIREAIKIYLDCMKSQKAKIISAVESIIGADDADTRGKNQSPQNEMYFTRKARNRNALRDEQRARLKELKRL